MSFYSKNPIDEERRELQRAAAMGDLDARYQLQLMEERLGLKKPMLTVIPHHCMRSYPQRACYATSPTKYSECYCDCQGCIANREARAREDGSLSETRGFHCYNRNSKKHGYCSILRGSAMCTCDCAACSRARFLLGKRGNPWSGRADVRRKNKKCAQFAPCAKLWLKVANAYYTKHGDDVGAVIRANVAAKKWMLKHGKLRRRA